MVVVRRERVERLTGLFFLSVKNSLLKHNNYNLYINFRYTIGNIYLHE